MYLCFSATATEAEKEKEKEKKEEEEVRKEAQLGVRLIAIG